MQRYCGILCIRKFFPQLVAGVERTPNLLPQFAVKRRFDYEDAILGLRQFLWGLFKKVMIADSCAPIVNFTFENYEILGWWQLFLGLFYFSFQIYGDFSGYSDMAVGVSRLFRFNLMQEFFHSIFFQEYL